MRRTWRLGAGVSVSMWWGREPVAEKAVSGPELEQAVADALERTLGVRPTRVRCPESLPARVGATVRGTLVGNDDGEVGLTLRADRVEGTRVGFNIKVDERPVSKAGTQLREPGAVPPWQRRGGSGRPRSTH